MKVKPGIHIREFDKDVKMDEWINYWYMDVADHQEPEAL